MSTHRQHPGRKPNATSPLGKLMIRDALTVTGIQRDTGISHRTISDYLARRKSISAKHLTVLEQYLGVPASILSAYHHRDDDPDGVASASIDDVPPIRLDGVDHADAYAEPELSDHNKSRMNHAAGGGTADRASVASALSGLSGFRSTLKG